MEKNKSPLMKYVCLFLTMGFLFAALAYGHGDEKHPKKSGDGEELISKEMIHSINSNYKKRVKPIFVKKCFDCHGEIKSMPWYFSIPGVKYLMKKDMEECWKSSLIKLYKDRGHVMKMNRALMALIQSPLK